MCRLDEESSAEDRHHADRHRLLVDGTVRRSCWWCGRGRLLAAGVIGSCEDAWRHVRNCFKVEIADHIPVGDFLPVVVVVRVLLSVTRAVDPLAVAWLMMEDPTEAS